MLPFDVAVGNLNVWNAVMSRSLHDEKPFLTSPTPKYPPALSYQFCSIVFKLSAFQLWPSLMKRHKYKFVFISSWFGLGCVSFSLRMLLRIFCVSFLHVSNPITNYWVGNRDRSAHWSLHSIHSCLDHYNMSHKTFISNQNSARK